MVEFAPGDALQEKLKRYPFIVYGSADLSRKTVDENVDLTQMVRYGDASIDIILCSHILEHIPEDRQAMRGIRRVLRADGFAIILVRSLSDLTRRLTRIQTSRAKRCDGSISEWATMSANMASATSSHG